MHHDGQDETLVVLALLGCFDNGFVDVMLDVGVASVARQDDRLIDVPKSIEWKPSAGWGICCSPTLEALIFVR